MVVWLFEQTKELKVGVAEMAVELGTAARLGNAGVGVPAPGVTVEELIFTDAFSIVVQIDVLQGEWKNAGYERFITDEKN